MTKLYAHPFRGVSFSLLETDDGHFVVCFTDEKKDVKEVPFSIEFDSSWVGLKAFVLYGLHWRKIALENETYKDFNLAGDKPKVNWIRSQIAKRCQTDPTGFDLDQVINNQFKFMQNFKLGLEWVNETIAKVEAQKPEEMTNTGMTLNNESLLGIDRIKHLHDPRTKKNRLILVIDSQIVKSSWFDSQELAQTIMHRYTVEILGAFRSSITPENQSEIDEFIKRIPQRDLTFDDKEKLYDKKFSTRFMITQILNIPAERLAELVMPKDLNETDPGLYVPNVSETQIGRQTDLPTGIHRAGMTHVKVDFYNIMGDDEKE